MTHHTHNTRQGFVSWRHISVGISYGFDAIVPVNKMRYLILVLVALKAHGQTRNVLLSNPLNQASINVTITQLPDVVGGTTINLSSATADWRDFKSTSNQCTGRGGCYGDRAINGSGIIGVFNGTTGQSPNYLPYMDNLPSITATYSDGTVVATPTSHTGPSNFFAGDSFNLAAVADNQVAKTLTMYWALANNYVGSDPSHTGTGTATFVFSLSDNSVAPIVRNFSVATAKGNGLFCIVTTYTAGSDGQELQIAAKKTTYEDGNSVLTPLYAMLSSPPTGPITRTIPPNADVQAELDAARPGDTLVFPPGTYIGNLVLTPRPTVNDEFGNPMLVKVRGQSVNLQTSTLGPGENINFGQRVQIDEATTIWSSPNNLPVLVGAGPNIHHWSFDGITLQSRNLGDVAGINYGLVVFTLGITPDHTTTNEALPHDIHFSHVVIHGQDGTLDQWNSYKGIILDGVSNSITDSLVTNFEGHNFETQAILIRAGLGTQIINNEVSASGESILLYNADLGLTVAELQLTPIDGDLMPDGVILAGNYVHKVAKWLGSTLTKNNIECKNCRNSHFYSNLVEGSFEGVYSDGQYGNNVSVANRNVNRPGSVSFNVEIDHNVIHSGGTCLAAFGPIDDKWTAPDGPGQAALAAAIARGMGHLRNVNFHHNLCDDLSVVWANPSPLTNPNVRPPYPSIGVRYAYPDNSSVLSNTFRHRELNGQSVPAGTTTLFNLNYPSFVMDGNYFRRAAFGYFPYGPSLAPGSIVNNTFDSNDFGVGDPICDAAGLSVSCFGDLGNLRFTNNLLRNVSVSSWNTFLSTSNRSYPGKWTGNTPLATGIATPSPTQGAPVALLLANECTLRTGNRTGVACTNPTPSSDTVASLDPKDVIAVSGQITRQGVGIPGITVQTNSGLIVTTDNNGAYLFPTLPSGSYVITPWLAGLLFTPPSQMASGSTTSANFSLSACDYSGIGGNFALRSAAPGTGTYSVTVANGCSWTAQSDAPWLVINPASLSGSGPGLVEFTYTTNHGSTRNATITITPAH